MIITIGAGIAGSLSAYYLARQGYEVLVIDQEAGPAMACSHANAGIIAVSHAQAWAKPAAVKDIAKALLGLSPSVKVSRILDPELITWGLAFLRQCTRVRAQTNSAALAKLASYSAGLTKEIGNEEGLTYHQTDKGTLYLYQDEDELEKRHQQLLALNPNTERFDMDVIVEHMPTLTRVHDKFAGGFHSTGDATGDCHRFAEEINAASRRMGARFQFNTTVKSILTTSGKVTAIETDQSTYECDKLVVSAGNGCPALLEPLGIKPLIYPVKGYSLTFPVKNNESSLLPETTPGAIDETELVSFSRLGDHVRLTGFAEFAGHDLSHNDKHFDYLRNYAITLFGDDIDASAPRYWTCLRPSTPSSRPYLGQCRDIENLYINAGHGQLGWTMSAGTGKLLGQLIQGEKTDLSNVSTEASWLNGI